jgi:hypothetical protein
MPPYLVFLLVFVSIFFLGFLFLLSLKFFLFIFVFFSYLSVFPHFFNVLILHCTQCIQTLHILRGSSYYVTACSDPELNASCVTLTSQTRACNTRPSSSRLTTMQSRENFLGIYFATFIYIFLSHILVFRYIYVEHSGNIYYYNFIAHSCCLSGSHGVDPICL